MKANVYNQKGGKSGTIDLPEEVFDVAWNADLVHQVVTCMRSNARVNVAHTKDRGEVRGGGKKPWPQKGTGQARHGSRRSPIWVGGGVSHGPRNEKNYERKINRKMKAKALYAVLSQKLRDNKLVFVDDLTMSTPKTKDAKELLGSLGKVEGFEELGTRRKNTALIALGEKSAPVEKSFNNIPSVALAETRNLNPYDLLQYRYLVIVAPDSSLESLAGKLKSRSK